MSATLPSMEHERAVLARRTRDHGPDHVLVAEARRDFRAARLAGHIERTLAEDPPLTDEQIEQLAIQLKGGDSS